MLGTSSVKSTAAADSSSPECWPGSESCNRDCHQPVNLSSSSRHDSHQRKHSSFIRHGRMTGADDTAASAAVLRKDSGFVEDYDVQPDSTDTDNESAPDRKQTGSDANSSFDQMLLQTVDGVGLSSSWIDETYVNGVLLAGGLDDSFQHLDCTSTANNTVIWVRNLAAAVVTADVPVTNPTTRAAGSVVRTSGIAFNGDDESATKRRRSNYTMASVTSASQLPAAAVTSFPVVSVNQFARQGAVAHNDCPQNDKVNVADIGLGSPRVTSSTRRFSLDGGGCVAADPGCDIRITTELVPSLTTVSSATSAGCRINDVHYRVFSDSG